MSPTGERNSVYNFEKKKNRIKLPETLLRQQDLKCRDKRYYQEWGLNPRGQYVHWILSPTP